MYFDLHPKEGRTDQSPLSVSEITNEWCLSERQRAGSTESERRPAVMRRRGGHRRWPNRGNCYFTLSTSRCQNAHVLAREPTVIPFRTHNPAPPERCISNKEGHGAAGSKLYSRPAASDHITMVEQTSIHRRWIKNFARSAVVALPVAGAIMFLPHVAQAASTGQASQASTATAQNVGLTRCWMPVH